MLMRAYTVACLCEDDITMDLTHLTMDLTHLTIDPTHLVLCCHHKRISLICNNGPTCKNIP